MGDKTGIEWTDATWSPLIGCRRVSEGCRHCYAERQAIRIARYNGIVESTPNGPRWTGASRLVVEALDQPLRWKRPRRVFVDSMADLFFEGHSNEDIAAVFGIMARAHWHTFQVLTKRPKRAREWFWWAGHVVGQNSATGERMALKCDPLMLVEMIAYKHVRFTPPQIGEPHVWPLPNVWLGVSAENQETADERIPLLLETPAAVRFVSYEPALGPVDLSRFMPGGECDPRWCKHGFVSWVIAGSESGPGARPAELEWFRSVRDQCAAAGVSFFFKQWVGPHGDGIGRDDATTARGKVSLPILDGRQWVEWPR